METLIFCAAVTYTLTHATPMLLAPELVATTLREVDQDFVYQGEYVGHCWTPVGWEKTGLQVVALGDGQFAARRFPGGLPGAGADRQRAIELSGERMSGVVLLRGAQGERVELRLGEALWYSGSRSQSARLGKVFRRSPTLGLAPPRNAVVLFAENQAAPPLDDVRLAADGTLLAGATTKMSVQDFRLHVEFRTPYMPHAREQGRGNSGVYVQRRYEVQILDSFGLRGANNDCGALYKQCAPDENLCLPPLAWQTYDIHFKAARWNSRGEKIRDAVITVYHNGIPVHNQRSIPDKTGAGKEESPMALPIHFQDHGNPVTFRNMWILLDPEPSYAAQNICCCQPSVERRRGRLLSFFRRCRWARVRSCRG